MKIPKTMLKAASAHLDKLKEQGEAHAHTKNLFLLWVELKRISKFVERNSK